MLLALLPALLLVGCGVDPAHAQYAPEQIYCEAIGYTFERRLDVEGEEIEVCVFPDLFECPARDFFRGACAPERTICALTGNIILSVYDSNQDSTYAVCRFPDGSSCTEFDYAVNTQRCQQARDIKTCVELPGGICRPYSFSAGQ